MSEVATVFVIFADAGEAERIGRAMIAANHAACVNILAPCQSLYRWNGAIEQSVEVPALFKTSANRIDALVAAIAEAHSYDVPAITVWPIVGGNADYLRWISAESR